MTTPQATPVQSQNKNCFLWGCLIVLVLTCLVFGCLVTVVGLAFAGIDMLGIEDIVPFQEFLDDPSFIPDFSEFFYDEGDPYYDEGENDSDFDSYEPAPTNEYLSEVEAVPGFVLYSAEDFYASFLYPEGWDIEVEEYRITFYDPDSNTYIYAGADEVDEGTTAAQVSSEVVETLIVEAEEGTFVVFENEPYNLPAGYDAYLNAFEWTDDEGYYQWAYDLEIIRGDSNIFFFLVGEEAEEFDSYRPMIETVADSFSK